MHYPSKRTLFKKVLFFRRVKRIFYFFRNMPTVENIVQWCDTILCPQNFSDFCHNGLQVGERHTRVQKIALGVSASKNFLVQAGEWGADMCLCHHGVIFGKIQKIDDVLLGRLQTLLCHSMAQIAYHLPLDAHPEYGNNIQICKKLGLKNLEKADIGFTGDLPEKMSWENFMALVKKEINPEIYFAECNQAKMISRVCVISGGASGYSSVALQSGADTFLFGELKESAVHEIRERNLNFIAGGHYATEVFGVQSLGEAIQKQFPEIEIRFIAEDCAV